jgi:Fe-S cluster assembly protein SufD
MTTNLDQNVETFFQALELLYKNLEDSDPLSRLRAKGWDHFAEIGLPTKKNEAYQYVRLQPLFEIPLETAKAAVITPEEIASRVLPECKKSYAVFINGQLDLSLSCLEGLPKKVVAINLQEALRTFGSFINNQVVKNLQEEVDPFAALNSAFIKKSLFFYVPPSTVLDAPFQILHIIEGSRQLICPHVQFFFGALSEGHVVSTVHYLGGESNFLNGASHFSLEEGAQVSYCRLASSFKNWHFDSTRACLKRDSGFKSFIFQNGGERYRDDYKIALVGSNAEAHLYGLGVLKENRESHTHVLMDHQAPECRSTQLFKGVLDGFSHSSFEGKIFIHKIAQKIQAFQMNNNLLLSQGARAESKPNLEIFADDVKASHGSTMGRLDQEQLFYLRTRGLSSESAKSLLVRGFCSEVIDLFNIPSLKALAMELSQ